MHFFYFSSAVWFFAIAFFVLVFLVWFVFCIFVFVFFNFIFLLEETSLVHSIQKLLCMLSFARWKS